MLKSILNIEKSNSYNCQVTTKTKHLNRTAYFLNEHSWKISTMQ